MKNTVKRLKNQAPSKATIKKKTKIGHMFTQAMEAIKPPLRIPANVNESLNKSKNQAQFCMNAECEGRICCSNCMFGANNKDKFKVWFKNNEGRLS